MTADLVRIKAVTNVSVASIPLSFSSHEIWLPSSLSSFSPYTTTRQTLDLLIMHSKIKTSK